MYFKGFGGAAIAAYDPAASAAFFCDVLDFQATACDSRGGDACVRLPSGQWLAFYSADNAPVEPYAGPIVVLEAEKVSALRQTLRARGVHFEAKNQSPYNGGERGDFFRDPDGVLYRLISSENGVRTADEAGAISWLGLRTENRERAVHFYRDILRLPISRQSERYRYIAFEVSSGQEIELMWAGNVYVPLHTLPVIAFRVADIRDRQRKMKEQGVKFLTWLKLPALGPLRSNMVTWSYFRGPDQLIYQLYQKPDDSV